MGTEDVRSGWGWRIPWSALAVVLILLAAGPATAIDCRRGDCTDGIGLGVLDPDLHYLGQWRNGRPEGVGFFYFNPSAPGQRAVYEGEVHEGKRHGRGVMVFPDGSRYEGQWREDRYHGRGRFVFPDGSSYEGDFADGDYQGYGVYTFKSGRTRAGWWQRGRYVGPRPPAK